MKTMRYLLIVMGLVSVLSISAQAPSQDWGKLPQIQMQSTSVMVSTGSTLPSAAATGAVVTGSTLGSYSPASMSGPHRAKKAADGDDEDTPPVNPPGPNENPLGDAVLPLMLLAAAYLILRVTRKRKSAMSK